MAVKIRLTRMGRKKKPFYRIIVADARSPRDGRFIEIVGTYNPVADPPDIMVKDERINYWLNQGAQPTDTVRNILQSRGIMHKRAMFKRGLDEMTVEEEMKKWELLQLDKQKRREAQADQKKKEDKVTEKAGVAEMPAEETPKAEDAVIQEAKAAPAEVEDVKEEPPPESAEIREEGKE